MADLQIRLIGPSDSFEELTALLHRAYAPLGTMGLNYTAVDQSIQTTRERVAHRECYLAFIDGRLAGTFVLGPAGPRHSECAWYARPGIWIIGQFGVEPDLKRQGIGSQLLTFAEQRAASLGAVETALDTADGAEHLLRLYTQRGYRPVGHVQWPGKTYRSVVLSKPLQAPPRSDG